MRSPSWRYSTISSLGIELAEGGDGDREPGDDARHARAAGGPHRWRRRDGGQGGDVPWADVLGQGGGDGVPDGTEVELERALHL